MPPAKRSPRPTASTRGASALSVAALTALIRQRRITDLVLGYPYNMDGSVGFKAKEVDAYAAKLKAAGFEKTHLVKVTVFVTEPASRSACPMV